MSAFADSLKAKFNSLKNRCADFAGAKDENGQIKNKNSLICIGVFVLLVLLIIILLCIKGTNTSLEKHPQDVSSVAEEVSFEDNKAVAVDEGTSETFELDIKDNKNQEIQNDEFQPFDNSSAEDPVYDEEPEAQELQSADLTDSTEAKPSFNLYCDSFSSSKGATEQKANIAFSTGFISNVVNLNGAYRLHLGPYQTRDEAVEVFNKLDSLSLVGECTLTSGE